MSRKPFVAAALVALVVTTAASAARGTTVVSSATTELMPGVTYTREVDLTAAGPVVLDVVTAPKPDGTVYSLAPVLSSGTLGGTETLTRMEKGLHAHATTVGLDGDFFNVRGEPNSLLMQDGVLENQPNAGRVSLGVAADGTLQAAEVCSTGRGRRVPASGGSRLTIDALVLSYTGVYASPVAPVLSPNGDGAGDTEALTYRLVRPATVTATLSGPNGASVPLETGAAEKTGVHSFVWEGALAGVPQPEGAWTFSVTATDDRAVTATAQRTFSLDNTLGSLTVGHTRRGEVAHFVLSRQANVVVRIERTNGMTVATARLKSLAAGPHTFTWSGRIGPSREKKGRYFMQVDATSSIGTSSLVQPFTLR